MAMSEKKMAKRAIVLAMDAVRKEMEFVQELTNDRKDMSDLAQAMCNLVIAFKGVCRS